MRACVKMVWERWCVGKMVCEKVLCERWCVTKRGRRRRRDGGGTAEAGRRRRVQNHKQEPHTKMWDKTCLSSLLKLNKSDLLNTSI